MQYSIVPRKAEEKEDKAEAFLYDMVAAGDPKYRKSLNAAISGQAKVRELLLDELPDDQWEHD